MAVKFIDHSSPVWVSERSCSHSMTVFFLILHLLCFSVVYKIEFGSQVQDVGLFWERKGRLNYLLLDLFSQLAALFSGHGTLRSEDEELGRRRGWMGKTRWSPVMSAKNKILKSKQFSLDGNGDISSTNKYVDLERR